MFAIYTIAYAHVSKILRNTDAKSTDRKLSDAPVRALTYRPRMRETVWHFGRYVIDKREGYGKLYDLRQFYKHIKAAVNDDPLEGIVVKNPHRCAGYDTSSPFDATTISDAAASMHRTSADNVIFK